ncbi:MAG: hypothetical protein RL513_1692 [Pseudomonadota bacterium]|jgi:uncharacterized membrane protein YkvA (DUF1232 family)
MSRGRWRARLMAWAGGLRSDVVTLWMALRHPGTPRIARVIAVLAVAYALSPIDLIPDFIPVLGYLDDVVLLPLLVWLALRCIPAGVLHECREQAQAWLAARGRKPVVWLGAALVVAAWSLIALALWQAFA